MSETIFYNQDRVEDRSISEMIGISKGLVADGVINEFEAEFLVEWVKNNAQLTCWPFNVLQNRIGVMLEDGVIDSHEREELFSLLKSLIGEKPVAEHISSFATTLPLTKPVPKILFEGKSFCFTGKFAYGLRKDCEKAVELRGGVIADNVTKKLDYLVIGLMGNEDWAHSIFGRKIQKAIDYNEKNATIAIIGEDDWANALVC